MIGIYLGTLALLLWGFLDARTGKVPALLLWIPAIIILFVNPVIWTLLFLPGFLAMGLTKIILEKKTNRVLGGADVFALPFVMFFLVQSHFWVLVFFPVFLLALVFIARKTKRKEIRFCGTLAIAWILSWTIFSGIQFSGILLGT